MNARILISFNNALMTTWMKKPLCCKSLVEENSCKKVEQEFSIQPEVRGPVDLGERVCRSPSKNWVAVVNERIELLISEAELNIQFNSSGIRWSRGDEQKIMERIPRNNGP